MYSNCIKKAFYWIKFGNPLMRGCSPGLVKWCVLDTSVVCKCGQTVCVTTSLRGQDVGSVAWTTAGTQGSVTLENQDTLILSLQHNPHNENYTSPPSLISFLLLPLQPCLCIGICPHVPCFSSSSSLSLYLFLFSCVWKATNNI